MPQNTSTIRSPQQMNEFLSREENRVRWSVDAFYDVVTQLNTVWFSTREAPMSQRLRAAAKAAREWYPRQRSRHKTPYAASVAWKTDGGFL